MDESTSDAERAAEVLPVPCIRCGRGAGFGSAILGDAEVLKPVCVPCVEQLLDEDLTWQEYDLTWQD